MAEFYMDSSVLVKRHASESGTAWVQAITDTGAGNVIITSHITTVEVISALHRKKREGALTAAEVTQLTSDFLAVCTNEYDLVDVTAAVLGLARTLIQNHPLKAYDAVQLASALLASAALQAVGIASLTFVAGDRQLLTAASAEGLAVDNPHHHP